jgi:Flp pilus assembly protein TadB
MAGSAWAGIAARRATPAVLVGLVVAVLTRWPVAALAGALLALFWPSLFGGAGSSRRGMDQLEALASWTESLRDTIAGAAGLEAAIPVSVDTTGTAIRGPVSRLADRLRSREPMVDALRRFGDDLDDASADLIVAALILNARLRGAGLVTVLGELSRSAREELDMRRRVEASRRSTRRGVQVIVVVTVGVAGLLILFNREYVDPYGSAIGQLVLAGIAALFGFAFWWLRRLSEFQEPARFLLGGPEADPAPPAGTPQSAVPARAPVALL